MAMRPAPRRPSGNQPGLADRSAVRPAASALHGNPVSVYIGPSNWPEPLRPVIRSFRNRETQRIYDGTSTKKARRTLPQELWEHAQDKLDILDSAETLQDLKSPPGNELEKLSGDRAGQHSIRINRQYRICFRWSSAGADDVEITDYH